MAAAPVTAYNRLRNDYVKMMNDPVPFVVASPDPLNILEWHYVLTGPPDSHYEGGYYHGKIVFPSEYPFKPPSIFMITPSGRFKCNTRICLSMSDYHPESWNPSWCTSTILTGLLSFMLEDQPTVGCVMSTPSEKTEFAKQSLQYNLSDQEFCEFFPDLAQALKDELEGKTSSSEDSS